MIKWIVITIIVLIALLDYALIVACSHMERREVPSDDREKMRGEKRNE